MGSRLQQTLTPALVARMNGTLAHAVARCGIAENRRSLVGAYCSAPSGPTQIRFVASSHGAHVGVFLGVE